MPDAIQQMALLAAVVAYVVACFLQRTLLSSKFAERTLDRPNQRSLHTNPTPRTGGIALFSGISAGWLWFALVSSIPAPSWLPALWLAALMAALVSLMDDLRGLSVTARLLAHFAVSAGFLAALAGNAVWGSGAIWILLLLPPMVWGINLYNFMDGVDGLAGGMAVFGFGAYALLAALQGGSALAVVCACVAAASLGFLPYNFAPAKVFLGDVGSIPLGFLAGALGVAGWREGLWPLWFPVAVFSPFVLDATVTLGIRFARGARPAEAHREHYYQRLAQLGFGHRKTALLEYGLMLLSGAAAITCVLAEAVPPLWVLGGLLAVELACLFAVDRAWSRHRAHNGQYQ
jgi:UDP-GlcNAc:undecaprenyl-phosphate/decaprenyl-phosphate GlcNAc-1-phosphate transferase